MEDVPTPDSLAPGEIVGPWRLEGRAGRGTYGVVYRARRAGHPRSEPGALKLALFPDDPRFVREVKLLSLIEHPRVPAFMDRGWWRTESGLVHPYVVMQWVEGLPLYDWAEMYDATSRQALHVLAQVARALEATHARGFLHRDVKGDNVRVEPNGRAFLMDYGSGTWTGAPLITDGPMPPGTRDYRSPEALRFHWNCRRQKGAHYEATPADDVYALGVAMYRVATGVHPPPGTDPEVRVDKLRPPLPPRLLPQALNGWVLPELASLIERMLAAKPQDRPSAREVAQEAEAAERCAGPEADVSLSGSAPVRAGPVTVQVRQDISPQASAPRWRPELVAFVVVLLVTLALLCVENRREPFVQHWEEAAALAEAEAPDAGMARDGGTADLGETAMTSQAPYRGEPVSAEAIALQMPEQPLPGQRLAPCLRGGEVEINGGCWTRLADITPPCGEDEYEWRGACYKPVLKRSRPPTTRSHRQGGPRVLP